MTIINNKALTFNLAYWLQTLEEVLPLAVDFKMERIALVAGRMNLQKPTALVVTVAGTNGKGSTSTTIASLFQALGLSVGLYTSPHIHSFNERIKVNQENIDDASLIAIFEKITCARKDTELSYFEYATLAALQYFKDQACAVIVLEVGLGGRFDATNIIDADIAVITPVDLDHMAYLGADRESIAREKAGIFRENQIVILSEASPANSLLSHALDLNANIIRRDLDFFIDSTQEKSTSTSTSTSTSGSTSISSSELSSISGKSGTTWSFKDKNHRFTNLAAPVLVGAHQYDNAACALATVLASPFKEQLKDEHIRAGLANVQIKGRLDIYPQTILLENGQHKNITWVFDVTHNPHGAKTLAKWLQTQNFKSVTVVLAMLKDKDARGLVSILLPFVDHWYYAGLEGERGQSAQELHAQINQASTESVKITTQMCFSSVSAACNNINMVDNDVTLILGSHHTVAEALTWYREKNEHS